MDHDGDEHRIMTHMEWRMRMEEQMGQPESMPVSLALWAEGPAKAQSTALVAIAKNLLALVKETDAEEETKELCNELCLTAEFFNKILQSEKFENIPF